MSAAEDHQVLAAEYVLGTLDDVERAQAEALMMVDIGFAGLVQHWERRLGELHILIEPVQPPPAIWEKIKAGLEAQLASLPEDTRKLMQDAVQAGVERVRLLQSKKPVPAALEQKVADADASFFSRVREMLGLDRALTVGVGAAPTPRDVLEFFHALGIPLAEGWGMSETTAVGTVSPPGAIKLGTVGKPIGDVRAKPTLRS